MRRHRSLASGIGLLLPTVTSGGRSLAGTQISLNTASLQGAIVASSPRPYLHRVEVHEDVKGDVEGIRRVVSALPSEADIGGFNGEVCFVPILLQKSKIEQPKNRESWSLDLSVLRRFSAPLRRSVIDFILDQPIWSLTSPSANRISGSERDAPNIKNQKIR